jgi:hypothetical protein
MAIARGYNTGLLNAKPRTNRALSWARDLRGESLALNLHQAMLSMLDYPYDRSPDEYE